MTTKFHFMIKFSFTILLFIVLLVSWKLFLLLLAFQILWRRFYKVRLAGTDLLLKYKSGQFFSPVHGKVIEILEEHHRYVLKISIGIFNHKAFYAMANSEVDSVEVYEHAQKTFAARSLKKLLARTKYWAMNLSFIQSLVPYSMTIINTSFSLKPSTIIMPGDRVRFGAHMGWIPMGGIILLELPKSGRLLIKEKDRIKMFTTLLMEKI